MDRLSKPKVEDNVKFSYYQWLNLLDISIRNMKKYVSYYKKTLYRHNVLNNVIENSADEYVVLCNTAQQNRIKLECG